MEPWSETWGVISFFRDLLSISIVFSLDSVPYLVGSDF